MYTNGVDMKDKIIQVIYEELLVLRYNKNVYECAGNRELACEMQTRISELIVLINSMKKKRVLSAKECSKLLSCLEN